MNMKLRSHGNNTILIKKNTANQNNQRYRDTRNNSEKSILIKKNPLVETVSSYNVIFAASLLILPKIVPINQVVITII